MAKLCGLMLVKSQSKRLQNKNTALFRGKPMFLWNLEKCLRVFDEVYVSSESLDILRLAESVGARPIYRGPELCGDVPNIPVYQHALQYMGEVDGVVAVQANSPTLEHNIIKLVKRLMEMGVREVMTSHQLTQEEVYHNQHAKVYGSVWGITRYRLEFYPDPYHPDPDVLIVDDSIDIETQEDFDNAILQWPATHQS